MSKQVEYTDLLGRKTLVILPDDVPDTDGYMGIPIGPPSLDSLDLPPETQTRIHNELFYRGLYSVKDVASRPSDVVAALMSALKVDAEIIKRAYTTTE